MQILIAGFGGQGVLFAGKTIAYCGLVKALNVSWLPSYGPEMRGGTANCSVILSETPVGSPIVNEPDILIAMNKPSYEKYCHSVVKGGTILCDSTLIDKKENIDDVKQFFIPATQLASSLANMVLVGAFMTNVAPYLIPFLDKALEKTIPPKKKELLGANLEAIKKGMNYGIS